MPGSSVVAVVFEFTHTDAVTAWPALITLAAAPVLLSTFPVMARRDVPLAHLPLPFLLGANLMRRFRRPVAGVPLDRVDLRAGQLAGPCGRGAGSTTTGRGRGQALRLGDVNHLANDFRRDLAAARGLRRS